MKRKSFPFLLALLMSMVANVALAYDVEIDGIYYDLSENEATVTYKDMNRNSYSGTVVIPESITYNSKTYSVTSIGYGAFGSSKNLTSITISKSVSSIGNFAFYDCSALTSITIPESVTKIGNSAFSGCSALTSITIPNSVVKIGDEAFSGTAWYENHPDGLVYAGKVAYKYKGTMPENTTIDIKDGTLSIVREAFSGCVGLSSITIPESVTEIGDRAFDGCNGLLSIKVKEGNPVYDSRNDCNALIETVSNTLIKGCKNSVIPEGITSIGDYAFSACAGLASITIPNSVTSIGDYAFSGCGDLISIAIHNSVTSIGNSAFIACGDLTSITIPGSVTSIGDMAFKWCRGLNSITISDGVKSIGEQAFQDCTSLTTINIPNSVSNIGKEAFDRTAWYDNKPRGVVYAGKVSYKYKGTMPSNTKINIKDGTLSISREAFVYCTNLVSINIPNSVTSIGIDAFWGCTGITSIDIPEGVTSIGASAFSSCSGLTTIKIPESVTEIGKSAFDTRSSAVSSIKVGMKTPISISEDTFLSSYECATLYVPLGCRAAYQAADVWKNFRSIVECDLVSIEDQIIVAGQSKTLEINVNTKSYTNLVGFQMDLTLPEGVGIDKAGCSLSSRITDENQELVIGKLENGDYRITSTSLSLTPISGNEGTLLTLKLTAEEGCVGGKATISNIIFSTSESEKIIMTDETFDIGILYKLIYKVDDEVYKTAEFAYNTVPVLINDKPTKEGYTFYEWIGLPKTMPNHDVEVSALVSMFGDVYTNEDVDVVDVVDIARFVVAKPSVKFREKLADLNRDNTVNIADAVTLVNYIAGDQNYVRAKTPSNLSYNYDQCQLQLLSAGQNALSLYLDGEADFTAFQFDVDVPEGTDISAIRFNGIRKDGHQLYYNKVSENSYRVTALSLSNAIFKGNMGELLQFSINGKVTDDICIHDIHFVTKNGTDITFDKLYISESVTGVTNANANENSDAIYDVQGRKLSKVQHGMNIVNGKIVVVK